MGVYIGIDPGLASVGYGIVKQEGSAICSLSYGVIETSSAEDQVGRLITIFNGISEQCRRYKPTIGGVETLYFAKNVTSALPVAQARGVILLALGLQGIEVREFTPNQIKATVLGSGKADKGQVQRMVQIILGLQDIPKPNHAADALAAAIACTGAVL
ncbi:MAG: crossover junction endodeoxyribonuclease RuvC [Spirochaetales bacterium]|nr:crossover junction endodeoxyribonuclease RuvC [Spirochaetales bacterium]